MSPSMQLYGLVQWRLGSHFFVYDNLVPVFLCMICFSLWKLLQFFFLISDILKFYDGMSWCHCLLLFKWVGISFQWNLSIRRFISFSNGKFSWMFLFIIPCHSLSLFFISWTSVFRMLDYPCRLILEFSFLS